MIEIDDSDVKALVRSLQTESVTYFRQWVLWLGVGSGAGGMGLISLAINLSDRNYAFQILLPSLWSFLVGVITAGLSVLFESVSMSHRAQHFADAHNRGQVNQAIAKMPEIIASPRRIADEANVERNKLIEKSRKTHESAELSWFLYESWKFRRNLVIGISAVAFVVGMGWPIVYLTFGGRLVP